MQIPFLKYKKIYFIFSATLILVSLVCLIIFGLKPGIDFTGGSILEIEYKTERPSNQEIKETLSDLDLGEVLIQPTEERGAILKMKDISEDTHQEVMQKLRENKELEERRFESIGPIIGQELKQKTKTVIILSLLTIILYIAWAFRKISRPLPSWQYGVASLLALFHDVLIPIGILSVLGKFYGVQITIPIITALLAVLGYSINNTVVVFDRIRENLLKQAGTYQEIVNNSLNQTLTRSINTSLTTLFVLVAIFFLGGATLKYFALVLISGIIAGTYSSLFLASPILVAWLRWRKKI
jgi:preprotein translocase subunit SecF